MATEFGRLTATALGETIGFDVLPGRPVTLGRSNECAVRLRDTKVSREHCRLSLLGGRLLVTDLGSTHGLVYRGQRCSEFELDVGEVFLVGETLVRFETREAMPAVDFGEAEPMREPPAVAAPPLRETTAAAPPPTPAPTPTPTPADAAQPVAAAPVLERVAGSRARPQRPQPSWATQFAAKLSGQAVVFSLHVIVVIALLLALKLKWPDCDIYRLLGAAGR